MSKPARRTEPRPWPAVTPGSASEAAWRATVQERLDSLDERVEDVLDAVTRAGVLERVWRHSCEVGERLLTNPSKGTIAIAAIGAVVALAVLGWTAADLASLAQVIPTGAGVP